MIKTMIFSFLVFLIPLAYGASVLPATGVAGGDGDPAAPVVESVAPDHDGGGAAARGAMVQVAAAATNRLAAFIEESEHLKQMSQIFQGMITELEMERDAAFAREARARVDCEAAEHARNASVIRENERTVRITQHGRLSEIFREVRPELTTLANMQVRYDTYLANRNAVGFAGANLERMRRALEAFQNPLLLRTYQRKPLADDDRFLGIAACLALPLPANVRPLVERVDLGDAAVVDRSADALAIITNNPYLLPNLDQSGKIALLQLLDHINNNPAARAQFEAVRNHRAGLDQLFHEARYGKSYSKQLLLAGVVLLVAGYAAHRYYRHQMKLFDNDIHFIKAAVKDENKVRALIAERRKWKYFLPGGAQRFNNNVMQKLPSVESVAPTSS